MTIDIITLGCSKNLVDSETLMSRLVALGYDCTHDSPAPTGEIAVINTCGFIQDAKQESIDTILEFAQRKEAGQLKKLYVMGCLSERYRKELEAEIADVDRYFGKFDYLGLIDEIGKSGFQNPEIPEHRNLESPETQKPEPQTARIITTPHHYAYIKISEGCNRNCAYCAIPIITGKHRSRPIEDILKEVEALVEDGTTEFQIIAQELTSYGIDLYGERRIAELIERMADIKGVKWIRLHYAYPTQFPYDLLRVMREKKNVCKYLDIALQHISDNVLKRMHRHITKAETIELIERIRAEVPGIHLRTTMMVGFPGETEEDFEELVDFVKKTRFERLGAFAYSEEDGTFAGDNYEDDVPEEVKQRRLDMLMRIQQGISAEIEEAKIGQTMRVVVDRKEGDYYIGRTEFCSPEVDPEVLIAADKRRLRRGCHYNVMITGAEDFDLYGEVITRQ